MMGWTFPSTNSTWWSGVPKTSTDYPTAKRLSKLCVTTLAPDLIVREATGGLEVPLSSLLQAVGPARMAAKLRTPVRTLSDTDLRDLRPLVV